ncbi:MAG: hypothetical protein HYU36_07225 [Planctomycetes bacterium]|nr:hypothetical protein [Planctomycetota bacterium]
MLSIRKRGGVGKMCEVIAGRWASRAVLGLLFLAAETAPLWAEKVVLKAGTSIPVEIVENLNSKLNSPGETVHLRVIEDVRVGQALVIPKGFPATGKVGETKASQSVGRGGEIEFYVTHVKAIDGQQVATDKDNLGSEGRQRTGATVGYTLLLGIPGLLAKGRQGFVLRGTQYDVAVKQDTEVDLDRPVSETPLKAADYSVTGKFTDKQVVKFAKGKSKEELEAKIMLSPEVQGQVQGLPGCVEVLQVGDFLLPKPLPALKGGIDAGKNLLKLSFDWWEVIRYGTPNATPVTVQIKLASGKTARAVLNLESEWKLK